MSIFSFVGDIFKPAADVINNISDNNIKKSELQNQLATIQNQIALKMLEFDSELNKANAQIAIAEQQYGNWLTKSWRPICSYLFAIQLILMGWQLIPFNETIAYISGSFLLGIGGLRSLIDKKK